MNFKVMRDSTGKEKIVQFEIDLSYGIAHLETPQKLNFNDIDKLRKWVDLIERSQMSSRNEKEVDTVSREKS
ncbi:MAG TPA: hypothetical protein VNG51_24345 [Ktedonobacteraceae bacterium]|nr:hypothetical protein [Ktedonobacteraceae bacterium]